MIIQKFGGTSVGSVNNIKNVADIVTRNESPKIVVLSAMTGTTDILVRINNALRFNNKHEAFTLISELKQHYLNTINQLITDSGFKISTLKYIQNHFNELEDIATYDYSTNTEGRILSKGEIITSFVFSQYLLSININNILLDATSFMFKNESNEPDYEKIEGNLYRELQTDQKCNLYITQGFICRDSNNNISNYGRGGSDYTASIIGSILNVDEIQIWSDQDGLLNNDPRFVDETYPLTHISFKEAEELAYFGAKILHPLTIYPARIKNIPIVIKNTFNPFASGTVISSNTKGSGIKAVASKDNISVIRVKSGKMMNAFGFLRRIFEIFDDYKTPVDVITTSEVSVSVTIEDKTNLNSIVNELALIGEVEVENNLSIVCLVGDISINKSGIVSQVFNVLSKIPIKMISQGSSNQNITFVVDTSHKINALNQINELLINTKECLAID